jgi:hypothetical protein
LKASCQRFAFLLFSLFLFCCGLPDLSHEFMAALRRTYRKWAPNPLWASCIYVENLTTTSHRPTVEAGWIDLTVSTFHIHSSRNSCMLGIPLKFWLQHIVICSCHVMHVQVNCICIHGRFAIKEKTHCLDIYNAQQVASGPEKVLQWSRLCAQNWYCKMVQRACCRNQACSAGGLLNLGH